MIAGVRADFGVHGGGFVLAQFAHIAHHKNTRRRHTRQHVNRGFHAVRVRVVSIVNQGRAFDAGFDVQTTFDIAEAFQTFRHIVQTQTSRQSQRGGSGGVVDIVAAGNRQHHGGALVAAHQIKFARQRFQHDIFRVNIAAIDTESPLLMTL